ncbi:30S ribosomal protein S10 [Halobium salinum]|uniref:Small ribosomal subunit protein uS10 n=1 Tax=Halobium salinum TaxID=1364940 RepID=A0ABD5P690_9EURY|nr:uS10/mL48 family ribosomal protein [Halobium salinum]
MTFVTKLRFESGDRAVLDETVEGLKGLLERKGAECKGPHADSPDRKRVPQYRSLAPGDSYGNWTYTVYTRRMEIHGNEHIAREVTMKEFPPSVHVEVEVEQRNPLGGHN